MRQCRRELVLAAMSVLVGAGTAGASINWDPDANATGNTTGGTGIGGNGTWDTTTKNWWDSVNSPAADIAWPSGGAAVITGATVNNISVGAPITVNGITTFVAATISNTSTNNITLSGNISVGSSGKNLLISAPISGAGFSLSGATTTKLTLSGTNNYTGQLTINSSELDFTTSANLGAAAAGVTINGGTLSYIGTSGAPTIAHKLTIGTNATINTLTSGANGKFVLSGTGSQLAGTGALKKTGGGWLTLFSGAAAGSTFTTEIDGGVIEDGSNTGLGSGAVNVATGGFLSSNSTAAIANNLTLSGGTLGIDYFNLATTTTGIFSGTVAVTANSTIQLGNFFGQDSNGHSNFNMSLTGKMSGAGNLALTDGLGATGGTLQSLTLGADNTAYTGTITVGNLHQILLTNTTGSATGTNAISILGGSQLGGTGIMTGAANIASDGTIFTGLTTNTLAKTASSLTIGSGSSLLGTTLMDLTGVILSDKIIVGDGLTSSVTFGGTLTVTAPNSTDFEPGQSYDLFDFGTDTGGSTFATVNLPTITTGEWDTSALYTTGIVTIDAVPEPTMLGVIAIGAAGALGLRRRRVA